MVIECVFHYIRLAVLAYIDFGWAIPVLSIGQQSLANHEKHTHFQQELSSR